jgi:transcriptional regulator with XRE-family HTH domain
MKTTRGNKQPNRLWLARKRRGLEQKQVTYLLDHKSINQLSHYEQGERLPSLENALKLEIIYGVPLRFLYKELSAKLEDEVWQRISLNPVLHKRFGNRPSRAAGLSEYCAYAELIAAPHASEADRAAARRHITALAKKMASL